MSAPDYGLLLEVFFGSVNVWKLFGIGVLTTALLMSLWMTMTSDGRKLIIAMIAAIGLGFLLGGFIDRQENK